MATKTLFSFFPNPPPASSSIRLVAGDTYRCSVCGKSFSSYQALGGHKSSHRRPAVTMPEKPAGSSCGGSNGTGDHQCSLCLRRFTTGQALGGHKRLHYWETASTPPLSCFLSVNVRGIDLNLPPPAEEEEEVLSFLPRKKTRLTY